MRAGAPVCRRTLLTDHEPYTMATREAGALSLDASVYITRALASLNQGNLSQQTGPFTPAP